MYTMQMFGLPGLVCTVSMNSPEGRPPIDVYGPKGLRRFLRTALELSRSILGFEYRVHELVHDIQPKEVVSGICLWYVPLAVPNTLGPERTVLTIGVSSFFWGAENVVYCKA